MPKQLFSLFIILSLTLLMFGCSADTTKPDNGDEKIESKSAETDHQSTDEVSAEEGTGGELRVGVNAQPPTIDPHISSTTIMAVMTRPIYETLVTTDSAGKVMPQLADAYDISEDGKIYTFHLRQNITFHNGKEMKAEDVVASMDRWAHGAGATVPEFLKSATFKEVDDYTVELQLEEASALTLPVLAKDKYYGAIIPKEVVESADETGVKEHIGTGPFKFSEWKQDQYIHLTQFEDYQPLDTPSDGLSGKKEALVNDIYFEFVPDSSTQVAGIQSGEFDIVIGVPGEYYDQLKSNTEIDTVIGTEGHSALFFNKIEGLFTDMKMRQAVNAALDVESIMLGGYGDPDLFDINSSYEQGFWLSDSGSEFYNEHDLDKAKRLLEESGYNGEPITFITSRDYESHYNQAIVIQEQLEKAGFNIELELYDWATRNERLEDPSLWDMSVTNVTIKPTPIEHIYLNQEYANGPEDEKTNKLIGDMVTSQSLDEAKQVWDELQGYLWEYLTIVKLGDTTELSVVTNDVEGFSYFGGPILWNTRNNK